MDWSEVSQHASKWQLLPLLVAPLLAASLALRAHKAEVHKRGALVLAGRDVRRAVRRARRHDTSNSSAQPVRASRAPSRICWPRRSGAEIAQ